MTEEIVFKVEAPVEYLTGKFSPEEDMQLRLAVDTYGEKNWNLIAQHVEGRSRIQCVHRWKQILAPGLVKGPWSGHEDAKLQQWVQLYGATNWAECAKYIAGRNGKQCRERWFFNLSPDVKKGEWTKEEDEQIYRLYHEIGPHWATIATHIPGRTDNSIKNRFYSNIRKEQNALKRANEPEKDPDAETNANKDNIKKTSYKERRKQASKQKEIDHKMLGLLEHIQCLDKLLGSAKFKLHGLLEKEHAAEMLTVE